jgi:hypothetical protein
MLQATPALKRWLENEYSKPNRHKTSLMISSGKESWQLSHSSSAQPTVIVNRMHSLKILKIFKILLTTDLIVL